MHGKTLGHLAAVFTVILWGTTFISTKVLLTGFQPVEILFFRFVLGLVALTAVCPKRIKGTTWRQELTCAAAGLCGVTLYFLAENMALTYTTASNVGVIVSAAPLFTAILARFVWKDGERLNGSFFLGFVVAMAGLSLISFSGAAMQLNPMGDLLALSAGLIWGCYSNLTRVISGYGHPVLQTTRHIFFYGVLFMIPALFFMGFRWQPERFTHPVYLLNLLFLGLGASAACFASWNFAVGILGAVKTSAYIYGAPVITVAASALILHEPVTPAIAAGTMLTLAGLVLSQRRPGRKNNRG